MSEDTTDDEYASAMHELLSTVEEEDLAKTISGVLEFLTMRATMDGGYFIMTDDESAITVFAANEDVKALRDSLPKHFKDWAAVPDYPNVVVADDNDEMFGQDETE